MNCLSEEETTLFKNALAWDKDGALNQLGNNHELLDRIVCLYLEKVPEIFIELEFFIEQNHIKEIYPLAHDLKDLSRSVGAEKIAELAKILETTYDTKDQEALAYIFETLKSEFQNFKTLTQ